MKNDDLDLDSSDTTARTVMAGDTVNIAYSNATTGGANNYVSCVIENGGGTVLFYGKLAQNTASSTASFTVPAAADLPDGDYTVKLFSEETNGDNMTDFCSEPIAISMTVDNSLPFVAVTDITGVPTTATSGTPLTLSGTVAPTDATNKAIAWSVKDAGGTGANITDGNTLNTTAAGAVIVTATIINGATASTNYTKDFTITVSSGGGTPTYTISYNANNGTGTMTAETVTQSGNYQIKPNAFSRIGYTFSGWNTAADGNGTTYAAGAVISNVQAGITLYAQWIRNDSGSGDDSGSNPTPTQTIYPVRSHFGTWGGSGTATG
jgi:uncharacterized repeat protein (TIGR02543 family)